ncbi:MAG: HD domain-containing protein [Vallitaleaceae bacterium]|jgi:(p)ppGpp synthase/HD superfamily hydrolase|nr:HD domain-containing protein [Vallitaleaceae bacterium]
MYERLNQAIIYATVHHEGSYRKGTNIPYIVHPFGAMMIMMLSGIHDEDVLISILLQDLIEDTAVTSPDIEMVFGKPVATLVESASEPNKSDTWENRKQHTIDGMKNKTYEMKLVTLADKYNNLESIYQDYQTCGEDVWQRFARPKIQQAWYYRQLSEALAKDEEIKALELYKGFEKLVQQVFEPV